MSVEKTELTEAERELQELESADDGRKEDVAGDADDKPSSDTRARDEKGRFAKGGEEEEEEEGEEGEEEEGEEEGEEDEGEDGGKKSDTAHRIRTVIEQRNKAREETAKLSARIAELEAKANPAANKAAEEADAREKELDDLYEKVEEARADGDTKAASQIQRKIDKLVAEAAEARAVDKARSAVFAEQQNSAYNDMLDHLEATLPVINPKAAEFDERIVAELDFQTRAYEKMGLTPTQALRRAASLIFAEDPFLPVAATKGGDKPAAGLQRKTDIAKNADAARRTPPRGERAETTPERKLDIFKMSDEDFDKLDENTLKKLSGELG